MPSSYKIDKDNNLIILEYRGNFSVNDLIELRKQVAQEPEFHPDMLCIDDITGVSNTDISSTELAQLAEHSLMKPEIRRAMVAHDQLQHGLARVYMSYAELAGQNFKLFDNLEAARQWLLEQ